MATDARSDFPSDTPYYLLNFERALAWLAARYDDLLDAPEHAFLRAFAALPQASRALLVRMLMRKGPLFRASRLVYDEIGCPLQAAAPMAALGWIDTEPDLSIDELFALSTRPQLLEIFADAIALIPGAKALRKPDLLETLRPFYQGGDEQQRPLAAWHTHSHTHSHSRTRPTVFFTSRSRRFASACV